MFFGGFLDQITNYNKKKKVQSSGHRLECLLCTFDLLHPRVDRPSTVASYFASPSEKTNNSERNSDGLQPAHGIGEWWRHDLVAPLLYPWRERGQSRWRVGWHGSSFWLLCLCVLCVVFCAASKTIRCSRVSPYLIF
jgi:hypothetical protein